jgi:uncharacterized protein (DUF362 family)/ferredoxin
MIEKFVNKRISLHTFCGNYQKEIYDALKLECEPYLASIKGKIVLKPNFNNDLNGLTGNSTDLRVLSAMIRVLKDYGFDHIVVADCPNLGIARTGANVLGRLGVAELCQYLGIRCEDANGDRGMEVVLENGIRTRIAGIFMNAENIICMPTIKTHAEAVLSCCLKNFIGVNIRNSKRELHRDLVGSIVAINKVLAVKFYVVDGLIAMEGDGPGDGIPRRLDWMLLADNPYLIDSVVARLIGLDPFVDVPYLDRAKRQGLIGQAESVAIMDIQPKANLLRAKPAGRMAKVAGHRSLGWLRDLVRPVFDNRVIRPFLKRHGFTQDIFEKDEANIRYLRADMSACNECSLCTDYCPIGLDSDRLLKRENGCIACGYCYWVCRNRILVQGEAGYLARHIDRYKALVENAVRR